MASFRLLCSSVLVSSTTACTRAKSRPMAGWYTRWRASASGFVGEFLTLIGTFRINTWVATLATIGTILSAAYALWLYRKVIFGKLEKPSLFSIKDLGWREMTIFAPLIAATILLGVYPKPVLDFTSASVTQLMDNYHH